MTTVRRPTTHSPQLEPASLDLWWRTRAKAAGVNDDWSELRFALPAPPPELEFRATDLANCSASALGEAYLNTLGPDVRLSEGRHYTPPLLAQTLWQDLEKAGFVGGRVVDPSCGAGALLLPFVRALVQEATDPEALLGSVAQRVAGVDLDPAAVWLGNAILASELLPLLARVPPNQRGPLPQLLAVADGLAPVHDEPALVIMNPPYGRVRLSPADRARWRDSLYGHANRYAIFLHAAVDRVAAGGFVAAVIPTSFLGGAYYQRLRGYVQKQAPLVHVTFLDARAGVFSGDVLQETCLAVFRKDSRAKSVRSRRLSVNGVVAASALPRVPRPVTTAPWLLPRTPEDGPMLRRAISLRHRLGDYGWKVSTGPLVWNRHKSQIRDRAEPGAIQIVWAADIDGSRVSPSPARQAQRWISLRPHEDFMLLDKPAVFVQRTTAPEQARRLVAAQFDSATLREWGSRVVVENHVNVLHCERADSPLSAELLTAILRTHTIDRLYRCLTGTVAVSAYELAALPLPDDVVLEAWAGLPGEVLEMAVDAYFDDVTA